MKYILKKTSYINANLNLKVHHMNKEHQNIDKHWVSHMCTENRIAGNHLSTEQPPITTLLNLDNGIFIPNVVEQQLQKKTMQTL